MMWAFGKIGRDRRNSWKSTTRRVSRRRIAVPRSPALNLAASTDAHPLYANQATNPYLTYSSIHHHHRHLHKAASSLWTAAFTHHRHQHPHRYRLILLWRSTSFSCQPSQVLSLISIPQLENLLVFGIQKSFSIVLTTWLGIQIGIW